MAIKTGTPANDTLIGTDAIDDLSGLGGDDQLTGGKGADVIDGGAGIDTARYDTAASAVSVDLLNFRGTRGDALGDKLLNIENVVGSQFADVIRGDGGNNVLRGLGGADALTGGGGFDTADYSGSKQGVRVALVFGTGSGGDAEGDTYAQIQGVIGSSFADTLSGDGFANVLSGGDGGDELFGGAGADKLSGGAGNDRVFADAGADILDGGSGFDVLDLSLLATAVQVDLRSGKGFFGDAEGDTYSGFESVIGTFRNDALFGSDLGDRLDGGAGADAIVARGGNDVIVGGAGADILDGGDGVDTVDYAASKQGIKASLLTGIGFVGDDAVGDTYTAIENLTGSAFDDELEGDRFGNVLSGGAGSDMIFGSAGADVLSGGSGNRDRLDYSSSSAFIQVDLASGKGFFNDAEGDRVSGFEIVVGSAQGDLILGDDFENQLFGEAGNDAISGRGANDSIEGGAGADSMLGGTGRDTLSYKLSSASVQVDLASGKGFFGDAEGDTFSEFESVSGSSHGDALFGDDLGNSLSGRAGSDAISGRGGDDSIAGGAGADLMRGGSGFDTLFYTDSAERVLVDLAKGVGAFGEAAGDTFEGFEGVRGSAYRDILLGDDGANTLDGGSDDDSIVGGGDSDSLIGGTGADSLLGGAGADTFHYQTTASSTSGLRDLIKDFAHGVDKIDVHEIDARAGASGNQAFSFIGGNAFTGEGQVRAFFEDGLTIVQLNTSGLGGAESEIALGGPVTLDAGDFIL